MRAILVALALGCWASSAAAGPIQLVPFPNLLANGTFDTGTAGWTLASNAAHPAWQRGDAEGSPNSGSLRATVPAGVALAYDLASQCTAMTAAGHYSVSTKVRSSVLGSQIEIHLEAFAQAGCTGQRLYDAKGWTNVAAAGWLPLGWYFTTTSPTSIRITLTTTTAPGGHGQTTDVDDTFLTWAPPLNCPTGTSELCIGDAFALHRFEVIATYASPSRSLSGTAHAVSLQSLGVSQGGLFWFFDASNPELLVKVLDGCSIDGYYWVYVAAGTNVGVDLRIGDNATGLWYLFHSPDGTEFPNIQNVRAIPCD